MPDFPTVFSLIIGLFAALAVWAVAYWPRQKRRLRLTSRSRLPMARIVRRRHG